MKVYINQGYSQAFSEEEIKDLKSAFPSVEFSFDIKEASDAAVAIASQYFYEKENLERFHNLKYIQTLSAGFDSIYLPYLRENNIKLVNLRGAFSVAIAEDVMSKILYFNKNIKAYQKQMEEHLWKRIFEPHDIYKKKVGILGSGSIGSEIAQRLKAFECEITGYNQSSKPIANFDKIITTKEELNNLYKESDYIIISLPLNDDTRGMINKDVLSKMKKNALLINIARGEIVNLEDLYESLKSHAIRGAALDVVYPEPLAKESKLWDLDNILITPHVSYNGEYIKGKTMGIVKTNLYNFLNNLPLINEIKL